MSVREDEEQRKKNCTGRGLGLAAAAIGVGVGAALYYFISKRPEQTTGEGSSSDGWREQPQALRSKFDDKDYITLSEYSSTDSMEEESTCYCRIYKSNRGETFSTTSGDTSEGSEFTMNTSVLTDASTLNTPTDTGYEFTPNTSILTDASTQNTSTDIYPSTSDTSMSTFNLDTWSLSSEGISMSDILEQNSEDSNDMEHFTSTSSIDVESTHSCHLSILSSGSDFGDLENNTDMDVMYEDSSATTPYPSRLLYIGTHSTPIRFARNLDPDSDSVDDWDVTETSLGVPEAPRLSSSPFRRMIDHLVESMRGFEDANNSTPSPGPEDKAREKAFRERRWSLEECSICFDVMLNDQELMKLPCTHNFHVACIGPWLQQQQTCPVCRKAAE